jgi:thiol-disulfide isomerase/thioredoxin
MANFKERIKKWKSRKWHQKASDVFFWLLLIMLIIPGPRKIIATSMNKVMLHLRRPSIESDVSSYQLKDSDYIWDIRTLAGENFNSETLKGEVIFLNFWGTYCPPCIAEMPEIEGIYEDYGDSVKFILISAEEPAKVKSFLDSRELKLSSYIGGRNMPEVFQVRSIPTTFIISRDGKIVSRKIGAADWDSRATRKVFDELLIR